MKMSQERHHLSISLLHSYQQIYLLVYIDTINNYHICKGGIVKYVLRITDRYCEACKVMSNYDHEGQFYLSHLHMIN